MEVKEKDPMDKVEDIMKFFDELKKQWDDLSEEKKTIIAKSTVGMKNAALFIELMDKPVE